MKDGFAVAADVINKAKRDDCRIALLRAKDTFKKIRAFELSPRHMKHLVGVYTKSCPEELVVSDVEYVIENNLCN